MDERKQEEEETKPRPRPRVVDKRVSARAESGSGRAAGDEVPSGGDTEQRGPAPAGDDVPSGGDTEPRAADPSTSIGDQQSPTDSPPLGSSSSSAPHSADAEGDVWTPEREEQARVMAQQIAETPSFEWVVNVAVTLANVAGTKLDAGAFADSRLAIDALAGIIDRVGGELGDAEAPLRQTLAHLQMGYAQVAGQTPTDP